jgi:hypothetical protein
MTLNLRVNAKKKRFFKYRGVWQKRRKTGFITSTPGRPLRPHRPPQQPLPDAGQEVHQQVLGSLQEGSDKLQRGIRG